MFLRFCLGCFALLSSAWAAEPYFEIIDNEENSIVGTITALDQTRIVVSVGGVSHTIPLEKLVKIRNVLPNPYGGIPAPATGSQNLRQRVPSAPARRGTNEQRVIASLVKEMQANEQAARKTFPQSVITLELNDGSRLTATAFTAQKDQGVFRLVDHPNDFSLPLKTLSAVRFSVRSLSEVVNPPADWQRLAVPNTAGDRLVVGTPDSFDVYTGILHEVSTETVSFAVDGEVLPVPRRKVFGLVFHHEPAAIDEPPFGTLTLWTGTKGMISAIRLNENELSWQTPTGLTATCPLGMVDEIDFAEKGIASLLDCELVRSDFSLPFASDIKPPQLNFLQTFYESRTTNSFPETTLDGVVYGRSITLRGKTSLEYLLPRPFIALKAVVGIEDQFRPHVSATFQIVANSQVLGTWELRGDSPSERIQVNLPQNCRTITFIVEPTPHTGLPAVLTIADPKLVE